MEHDSKCEVGKWAQAFNRKGGDITDDEVFIVRNMTQECCNCLNRKNKVMETFLGDLRQARNLVDAVSEIRELGITVRRRAVFDFLIPTGDVINLEAYLKDARRANKKR